MSYIGKTPLVGNYQICDALTASATADYTLQVGSVNVSPQSANAMIVSLNGVIQGPGASRGFTVSGSTISFNSALTSSDVIDFIYIFGDVLDVGTPTDDTVTTAKIVDNAVTLAKLEDGTQGDVLYYGASGAPARLGFGTSGDFLKTQGTGANPVWAAAGGGKIGQVVQTLKTDSTSTTSTTFVTSGFAVAITPAATTSKVLLLVNSGSLQPQWSGNLMHAKIDGGNCATYIGDAGTGYESAISSIGTYDTYGQQPNSLMYLDSPATTSETTYTLYWCNTSGTGSAWMNRAHTQRTDDSGGNTASTFVAMEILA
jgi:hypothetical protein